MESRYVIMDGQSHCKVGPWIRLFQLQRAVKEEDLAEKESMKLTKARRRGFISAG